MSNRFTEKAEKALNSAVACAEDFGHTYIGSEHILLSLAQTSESSASVILTKHSATAEKIKKAIGDHSGSGLRSTLSPKDMTPCAKKIVEGSYRISVRYGAQKIGTEHILLALLDEKESVSSKLLSYLGVDTVALSDEVTTLLRCADKSSTKPKEAKEATSALRQHGKNLTSMARDGRIDPVIGRDKETDRLIRILSRKSKNNPCLIGEAGVGKTAIVEGLAQRIISGKVPPLLLGKEIICVDLTSMVSGTKYRGDFEERIKSLLNEASNNKSIILFIDEIHTIVGAGAAEGAIDAANILKPQLSRGELQIIGATTFSEYHKYIEKDSALERRFQPITVEEPSVEETKNILHGVKERYERHHGVVILDEAIDASVKYSCRYIQDRFLPDKALDILDEACAKANAEFSANRYSSDNLGFKLRQIKEEKDDAIKAGDFILAKNLHELEVSYENASEPERREPLFSPPSVTESNIKEIINEITGIPILGIGKRADKATLKDKLSEKIIGQDEAISSLVNAICRSESGVCDPERPKGVYLFIGGSGVGKTELAKQIAALLFFDKNAFFKYDMSEFSESNSVTKLIGSPPGYVGHEDGGALIEKIRRHPYSIILFDEIEKAHRDVIDLFLQMADSGTLTDASGRSVSFRNSYIIFTSNLCSDITKDKSVGFVSIDEEGGRADRITEELSRNFRIEFINRIDEIVLFSQISLDSMKKIADKRLYELKERLCAIGYTLEYTDDVSLTLAKDAIDEKFGVRKLIRVISTEIENRISDIISEDNSGGVISVYASDGKLHVVLNQKSFAIK